MTFHSVGGHHLTSEDMNRTETDPPQVRDNRPGDGLQTGPLVIQL